MKRKPARKRRQTPAFRDGVILSQLFTAENVLLRIGNTRGLPEDRDIGVAILALGRAIKKARTRVDTKP